MRYITKFIKQDLEKKMVFVAGPRQSGKTTLAKNILQENGSGRYFNWDRVKDRQDMLKEKWHDSENLLIFDEIHKYRSWKNWLKGTFDTFRDQHQILVTGSARLNAYKKGGDSLMGRYHLWRLHPFTLSELPDKMSLEEALRRLLLVGGFPEPFLDGSERSAKRWRRERNELVIKEDIRDLERIKEIQLMELLLQLLKSRVGSPVVASNLAQELQVSPVTVARWLLVLERMYVIFIVRPFASMARAIQKPPKVYFFDNAEVDGDEGARFENLVATHLLKSIHFLQDSTGDVYDLAYVRDKEKREVDFVVLKNKKVLELIEVKWADSNLSSSLHYFSERLKPKRSTQIVGQLRNGYSKGNIQVRSALELLPQIDWFDPESKKNY